MVDSPRRNEGEEEKHLGRRESSVGAEARGEKNDFETTTKEIDEETKREAGRDAERGDAFGS